MDIITSTNALESIPSISLLSTCCPLVVLTIHEKKPKLSLWPSNWTIINILGYKDLIVISPQLPLDTVTSTMLHMHYFSQRLSGNCVWEFQLLYVVQPWSIISQIRNTWMIVCDAWQWRSLLDQNVYNKTCWELEKRGKKSFIV